MPALYVRLLINRIGPPMYSDGLNEGVVEGVCRKS
jgi:hypothetical protein